VILATLPQSKKKKRKTNNNNKTLSGTFCNKHCSEILMETPLNSVTNGLFPFMVGQSHESFTLLSVNNVGLFHISALSAGK
jgi:hypothetical protein